MSETTIRPLPKWIWIYGVVVMIIMSLGIAVVLLVSPGALPPELSSSLVFGGPFGLLGLNVARHLATALAAAFALYRRSANMMLLLFMIRILFDIPEYTFSVISGDYLFPFVPILDLRLLGSICLGCSHALAYREFYSVRNNNSFATSLDLDLCGRSHGWYLAYPVNAHDRYM